ncbi:DMT family transporter [Paraburkholderia sp. MPAMCS5]|uniref:DMT family transporter n=1 Tax=Paraburkholderia sp. MPAMCS5 TaxID=3112563 RepID=UPI002E18B398|nr:DMT family transporter [Paraburkholderia sp. MPAMCS5]
MPASASTHASSLSLGSIGSILASMFCFAVVDALAKTVSLQYPANEVTFFRMLFGLVPAFLLCCRGSRPLSDRLRNLDVKGQTARALALLGASALFFAGLPYVPLSEAVALAYSETLIVILLAPLMLDERLTSRGAGAAIVGFLGVLLVVRPGGAQSSWLGPAILMGSAFCGAVSIVQIKRIRATDDSATTVLFFTAMGAVIMGCTLFFNWRAPSGDALLVMAALGVFATAGQVLMTAAFRRADAGALAPYNYTSIVWAALFGYLLWGETLELLSVAGILMIVASAIAVAVRRKAPEGPLA